MSLLAELRRRNVLRIGAAYLVVAWLVIQVVETVLPAFGFGIVAVRIVTIVAAIGLLPALILAWIFELTPEGLKRERDVDRSVPVDRRTLRQLDRMIFLALVVALVYFAFDKFVLSETREAAREAQRVAALEQARLAGRSEALLESFGDRSIAVLAFDDMSADRDQEYLSDGIAEELLNLLTRIPELRVTSRSSAFSFKGQGLAITEIADRLRVAHVLEGSVRKAGNRVRITAQLIDARSDTRLWAETYDRDLDDIFAIQDEIASTVVDQLRVTLLGDVPTATETNPEAYALFLRGRHLGRQLSEASIKQSNALYEQALAIDPDYAAAWNGLASNYINQAAMGLQPRDEGYQLARGATENALRADPDFAQAHESLGWIAMAHDNDPVAAASHYERALALDPASLAIIGNSGLLMSRVGRLDQAIALREYFTVRDPVSAVGHGNLGASYLHAGRWDDAIAAFETALQLSPGRIGAHYGIAMGLLYKGDATAAVTALEQESSQLHRLFGLAMAHHVLGQHEASAAALDEALDSYPQLAPFINAAVHAYRGEVDIAFEWLQKAVESGSAGLAEINVEPAFTALHDDPRWVPLLESLGKSPAQLAAIEFNVTLPR